MTPFLFGEFIYLNNFFRLQKLFGITPLFGEQFDYFEICILKECFDFGPE